MSSRLDQVIKGAPSTTALSSSSSSSNKDIRPKKILPALSPLLQTPSPPALLPAAIYLNLLILETSLRSQYLALRARRQQNTFFILLLALWIAYFSYALFLRPREDGRGVGGSVYWVVEMAEKVALMGGVVTGVLIWGTGQWERGVRWPRRWLGVANRGLRGMNTKIVVLRGPWWKEAWSYLAFLFPFPYEVFFPSTFHYVESRAGLSSSSFSSGNGGGGEKGRKSRLYDDGGHSHSDGGAPGTTVVEEDIAPGGDYIKLLLLPKSFSPAFRENWDEYRSDYWEKENERRAALRRKLKEQRREHAKMAGGWFWWMRLLWAPKSLPMPVLSTTSSAGRRPTTPSGSSSHGRGGGGHANSHSHSHSHHHHLSHQRDASTTSTKRRPGPQHQQDRDAMTHSRTSSRSTTPNPVSDTDDPPHNNNNNSNSNQNDRQRRRRGSSAASTSGSERKRRNKSASSSSSAGGVGSGGGARAPSPLTRIEPVGQV
ncbi:conserved hypothetical protein [Histoplasma capsulatum H143]|uniref:Spo7-like protein n=1 Tax=Ajellomyces capsulatus (strain H143) TaxID=544712 RepID=C6HE44_AJECH|nr:conserved hypothetical protein [Histoplasma capsulatum H143]